MRASGDWEKPSRSQYSTEVSPYRVSDGPCLVETPPRAKLIIPPPVSDEAELFPATITAILMHHCTRSGLGDRSLASMRAHSSPQKILPVLSSTKPNPFRSRLHRSCAHRLPSSLCLILNISPSFQRASLYHAGYKHPQNVGVCLSTKYARPRRGPCRCSLRSSVRMRQSMLQRSQRLLRS